MEYPAVDACICRRPWRIFSIQPEVREPEHNAVQKLEPSTSARGIDFNQIRFSYTDDQEVLHGLDLHVKPGEFIGIVGTTGAGRVRWLICLRGFMM